MERLVIDSFKGLNTTDNPTLLLPGQCRQLKNILINKRTPELRDGIDRVWATRTANVPVYAIFQHISNAGTITNYCITNGLLEQFSLTPTDSKTNQGLTLQSINIPCFTQFLNQMLLADHRNANYIGTNTYGIAAPTAVPTLTAQAGTDLSVGTYRYCYARYSSTTRELSPAYATNPSIVLSGSRNVSIALSSATSGQFDQIRLYRTKANGNQLYRLATIAVAAFPYVDAIADTTLITVSELHTSSGASNTSQVEAATDVVQHKGRLHWVGLSGARSRHRWTQLNSFVADSTTDARHDVYPDDGDYLWRAFSYEGVMVLFKDHSIHLMNGDVNERSFTWQVTSEKRDGIGGYCPYTAVATPLGIIFQGERGVYIYRPGGKPGRISGQIQTSLEGWNYNSRNTFVGGYDPYERVYYLSGTTDGNGNNRTFGWHLDTAEWNEIEWGIGFIEPSCYATMENANNQLKLYIGSYNGYAYETSSSTGTDGVTSGTESGTATSGDATHINDTGAAFRTAGNGLLGLGATIRVSSGTYESQEISANSAIALTTSAFTNTPNTQSYFVGAIEGIISLGRMDCGNSGYKRFLRLNWEFRAQTHGIPLYLGYTMDGDTEPTLISSVSQTGIFRVSTLVNRIGVGISPYIRAIGVNHTFTVMRIELDYVNLLGRPG